MSEISIVDLEVYYRVGVPEAERAQPQRLLLTVEMALDFAAAARSDRVEDTIDYRAVADDLLALGQGRSWRLIEKVAADIAELILTKYRPESVSVEVKKFIISEARHVAVSLSRVHQA
jgi:dihydroneopterin aldolase